VVQWPQNISQFRRLHNNFKADNNNNFAITLHNSRRILSYQYCNRLIFKFIIHLIAICQNTPVLYDDLTPLMWEISVPRSHIFYPHRDWTDMSDVCDETHASSSIGQNGRRKRPIDVTTHVPSFIAESANVLGMAATNSKLSENISKWRWLTVGRTWYSRRYNAVSTGYQQWIVADEVACGRHYSGNTRRGTNCRLLVTPVHTHNIPIHLMSGLICSPL